MAGGTTFREDINGLRAIAVLGVMLFHFRVPGFRGGFAGVDIFFVISGFLMTQIIVGRLEAGRFGLAGFYLDRARRIVPALLALIAVVLAFGFALLPPDEYRTLGKHAAAAALFVSDIVFYREAGYFDAGSIQKWLLHSWSLAVEWQFYLLYPIVLVAAWTAGRRRAIAATAAILAVTSFALCVFLSRRDPSAAFYLLPPRGGEMLAGGLVALFPLGRLPPRAAHGVAIAGLAGVLLALLTVDEQAGWPGWATLLPVVATMAVLAANRTRLWPLGLAPVAGLGTISYSVYLWHWPVIVTLDLFERFEAPAWRAAGLAASIALGALSYRLIERPTRNLGRRAAVRTAARDTGSWRHHAALVVATLIVLAPAVAIWRRDGLPGRGPPAVARYDAESQPDQTLLRDCFDHGDVTAPCFLNGGAARPVGAILIGDSHALAVAPAVAEAMARLQRGAVYFRAYPGCPTIVDAGYPDRPSDKCLAFNRAHLPRLLSPAMAGLPVIVVNSVRGYMLLGNIGFDDGGRVTPYTPASYRRRFTDTVCHIAATHPVAVLDGYPDWDFDVPHRMARRLMRSGEAADIDQTLAAHRARHAEERAFLRHVARTCHITLLDPAPSLCRDGRCPGTEGRRALYYDAYHLNDRGAMKLTPLFERFLASVPAIR